MNIFALSRTYRSIGRLRDIAVVLSRHGFNQMLRAAGLTRFLPLSQRFQAAKGINSDTPVSAELRMVLEDLGPTFVKLGQMLSMRPDLAPPDFVKEFKKLRDAAPPFDFAKAKSIIEEETGAPLDEIFLEVNPKPIAAASIGQVHAARLKDGSSVVLKIQRPGIDRVISSDLATLYLVVGLSERYLPELAPFNIRGIVDEFAHVIRRELDFFLEASNTERFRLNSQSTENVLVPKVYWELTTKKMLVLEAITGIQPDNPEKLRQMGVDPSCVAKTIARSFLKQVFEDGLFHGDLHSGNILITPEGKVAFLDFGAVGYLAEEVQENLGQLFMAITMRDYASLADGYSRMGLVDETIDRRAFERDLCELVEPYYGRPLGDLKIGDILREATQIALKHRIHVQADLSLLGRSILTVEGVAMAMDPGFLILDEAVPYAKKLVMRRMNPKRHAREIFMAFRDLSEFVRMLPSQLSKIFQKTLEDRLTVDFVHKGYEPMLDEMDRSSNRISFSMIISALIVGSALVTMAEKGPMINGFPVIGILGFTIAGVLGLGLAVLILKSGKY